MEASGFKARLEKAYSYKEPIKIIFQYPASHKAIVKRGIVLAVYEDSFDFNEILDGNVTYSYKFIAEIKGDAENGFR